MTEKVYSAGTVIFREGDQAQSFFQIVSGAVGVYLCYGEEDELKLTQMMPGQFFGELAIIGSWPRSSTVVAEEELRVIEIPGDDLHAYFSAHPDQIPVLLRQLSSRIRTLTSDYNEVSGFLKQKQDEQESRTDGFFSRMKRLWKATASMDPASPPPSEESILKTKYYGRAKETNLPVAIYNKGQIIFREGEIGAFMYTVRSGSVGIFTGYGTELQNRLTTLQAGDIFGEMGLIDSEKRSATAVVEEHKTTLEIAREEDLQTLFEADPAVVDQILTQLARRLRSLTVDYILACKEAVTNL